MGAGGGEGKDYVQILNIYGSEQSWLQKGIRSPRMSETVFSRRLLFENLGFVFSFWAFPSSGSISEYMAFCVFNVFVFPGICSNVKTTKK